MEPIVEKFSHESPYCNPNLLQIEGVPERRNTLPNKGKPTFSMARALGMVKKMGHGNLSNISLPVFINEPTTILQKTAEIGVFSELYLEALKQEDPVRRMLYVVTNIAGSAVNVTGRTSKPFITMLGETFEMVTDKYRYYGECVEEKPPILAFVLEGDGFRSTKTVNATMHFNGSRVRVHDPN